jgi:phospholipase C
MRGPPANNDVLSRLQSWGEFILSFPIAIEHILVLMFENRSFDR